LLKVQRYVENYSNAPRFISPHVRMTDISLDKMIIKGRGNTFEIPFDPPMKDFSEARTRLVKMDADSIKALSRSPYTIKTYRMPVRFHAFIFAVTFSTYIMLLREQHVLPGSIAYEYFLKWIPYFPFIAQEFRLHILAAMVVIHGVEAYIMSGKLKKHSAALYSPVWWAWMVSCFIEGFGSFQRCARTFHCFIFIFNISTADCLRNRIDAMVDEQRIAKEKAKH
jgi:hypothetical protein